MTSWKEEYWKSIKSFDTEEKLDLYFYRPVGFLIAKIAWYSHLTPTMLTVMGLILGISSGFFFYKSESYSSLIVASILFIFAGVFDSSDGQLARMGGKSTKLGLVLDGLCDNLVFASVYIGASLTVMDLWGYWIWPIAVLAGFCHSFQSAMLDYYNREYLYFGNGKVNGDYWNPTLIEARQEKSNAKSFEERIFWQLRFSWLWQQNKLSSRDDETRYLWKKLLNSPDAEIFQARYRKRNRIMLRFWRLMGPNFHTIMILIFIFLHRFDLYLIVADIFALTIALFVLRKFQAKQDAKLLKDLKLRGLA
jgi:hypothetical protein